MIVVIDYGAGNLKSVTKALDFLGVKNKVSSKAKDIEKADKLILPGVGNFGDMMKSLKKKKLIVSYFLLLLKESHCGNSSKIW